MMGKGTGNITFILERSFHFNYGKGYARFGGILKMSPLCAEERKTLNTEINERTSSIFHVDMPKFSII